MTRTTTCSLARTGEECTRVQDAKRDRLDASASSKCFPFAVCFYRTSVVPSKYLMTAMIAVMMICFYYFARHVSHLFFPGHISTHCTDVLCFDLALHPRVQLK